MSEAENPLPPLSTRQKLFVGLILTAGIALAGATALAYIKPPRVERDISAEAKILLRSVKSTALSESLNHYLETGDGFFVDSMAHPLLGKKAPDFRLPDHRTDPISLSTLLKNGPVVVVFYLGYSCDHCVAQLFGMQEDLKYFEELGASIVAISPDSPDKTTEKFKQHGPFKFPVVADYKSRVAEQFGVHQAATDRDDDMLLHATFVIDRDGIVRWVKTGENPFFHNPTLLRELAKIKGMAPPIKRS